MRNAAGRRQHQQESRNNNTSKLHGTAVNKLATLWQDADINKKVAIIIPSTSMEPQSNEKCATRQNDDDINMKEAGRIE